jgi:hypothetical protein
MKEFLAIFVPTIKRNAFTTKNESYEKVTINKNKNSNYLKTPVLYKYRCFFCACFIHFVMPARVGMSVGAVRCQSGWVASHVRGMWVALRGSGLQIVALAMRHNVSRVCDVLAAN